MRTLLLGTSGGPFSPTGSRVAAGCFLPVLCALTLAATEARAFTYLRGGALSVDGPYTGPTSTNFHRERFDESSQAGTSRADTAVTSPSAIGPLADAGGEVSHGVVRARAYVTHATPGVYQGGADVEAGFSDELTFSAPGRAGTQGTVTFAMHVDGTLSSRSTHQPTVLKGYSEASVEFSAESTVDYQGTDRDSYSSTEDGASERVNEPLTLTLGIVFGDPVDVYFSLELVASVFSLGSGPGTFAATGIADFRDTATWAGVLEVRDAQGDLIEDFEVTSASGTDYRGPIAAPEPGRALLVGVGLVVLRTGSRLLRRT